MRDVKVTMLLADFAQVADGKLTVVGGGWSLTGPEPTPFGIAILVHVPWDQANRRHITPARAGRCGRRGRD